MLVLLVILFLLIALAMMLRKARTAGQGFVRSTGTPLFRQAPRRDHKPAIARQDFSAVTLRAGSGCCRAAARLAGTRGFPGHMPQLPLPQCAAPTCDCRYEQHADRRATQTRRSVTVSLPEDERRRMADRRQHSGVSSFRPIR